MNEPNVNGVAIRVGDTWVDAEGKIWRVLQIDDHVTNYPVRAQIARNPSLTTRQYTRRGEYDIEDMPSKRDLVKLISRAEPDLPEDIADQFEAVPDARYERQILHAYADDGGEVTIFSRDRCSGTYWLYSSCIIGRSTKGKFRRKERWEPGAFVSEKTLAASSIASTAITHERNTVTGEISGVWDE